ncbi:MAG: NTP transferase domain-containing protein [Candidatus Krumholzibacteria bacterium]|jgi:bifunctional UDP-N-acetylglucosamine pyrophosphorylase/glucosamine-1-phosphate N-acetyltransferase|nr:NTP transferase domain-containing protein [Candidatus Krumholzibacteria bacterium]MDP6669217.1 NTP transferase domain-containing protein [Candidatus Krumholzibacteria bacterium]MDP6796460.1 NTP transferase domain-containing protein [Candidatus Krumholzibacteria bacterium]MDP7021590.1 NTP transferase domain-containing protein [Candidatus Krumholzibacteria bacterium]
MSERCAALVLAAGKGTRMKSDLAKVLHPLDGKTLIRWVLEASREAELGPMILVLGHQADRVRESLDGEADLQFVLQEEQRGTGHAVMMAREILDGLEGDVLVLAGDVPLIRAETLRNLLDYHHSRDAAATVLSAVLDDPTGYGRILRNADGDLEAIREHRDASEEEREIREINSGIYVFKVSLLLAALDQLGNDNDQGEYYLTDTLEILRSRGQRVAAQICPDPSELEGINDREQLLAMEQSLREREI